ncbi:MAG: hypothetical protein R2758_15270 [Bacteroidales bacterium]
MDSTLRNLGKISQAVADADLGTSLVSLRSSLTGLDTIVKGISKGEGTAGKLLPSLYDNLR